MVALASLHHIISGEEAVPLIKKVLNNDESLQLRSMAIFALGIKQILECYPILVRILETDPDYAIPADACCLSFRIFG
jgi:HEAT repeat protein